MALLHSWKSLRFSPLNVLMLPLRLSHIALAFGLAIFVSWAAFAARSLTRRGAFMAVVLGTVIAGAGGWLCAEALLAFFVTSSALSRWRKRSKEALAFEKSGPRDAAQVWANGGVAACCALLPVFHVAPSTAHLLFLAALAAANADTWATEIGAAWGGAPFLISTGQRASPGVSGGVSAAGTVAALLGAALLGLFGHTRIEWLIVTVAGWGGALFDSLLGATLQAQWRAANGTLTEQAQPQKPICGFRFLRNDSVNFSCTLFAAAAAAILREMTRH
jgi:uncharacterized protein (TIGR00297 family)